MQYSRFEKMVFAPGYPRKCRWHYLYLGLLFVFIGLAILANGYLRQLPLLEGQWNQASRNLSLVVPNSKTDAELLEMSKKYLEAANLAWSRFLREQTKVTSMYFFFVGFFLIGSYYREKRYNRLLGRAGLPDKYQKEQLTAAE